MQGRKRLQEFVRGCLIESARHSHITKARPDDVGLWNRRQRHGVTGNLDRFYFAGRDVLDSYFYLGATWSKQELAHFGKGLAAHRLAVDLQHLVAEAQARLRGRRFPEGGADKSVDLIPGTQVADSGADSEIL